MNIHRMRWAVNEPLIRCSCGVKSVCVVARGGVEPPTFHFSGERYYQLSYLALATPTGLETATSAVTGRRANQLRYGARSRCLVQATRKL